jgi:hypothetical protein
MSSNTWMNSSNFTTNKIKHHQRQLLIFLLIYNYLWESLSIRNISSNNKS